MHVAIMQHGCATGLSDTLAAWRHCQQGVSRGTVLGSQVDSLLDAIPQQPAAH